MDFTKLKLVPTRVLRESKDQEETPKTSVKENKIETSSFNINSLMMKKELIRMREEKLVNWRRELEEENEKNHPYVDVMPGGETEKDILKTLRKKKKEQE